MDANVVATGPLVLIEPPASLGLTADPYSNPIGFGILAGITIWPAVGLILWGIADRT